MSNDSNTDVDVETETNTEATPTDTQTRRQEKASNFASEFVTYTSTQVAIVGGVFSVIIGGLAAWATANMGISSLGFLVGAAGAWWWLSNMPNSWITASRGCYASAPIIFFGPLLFYLPVLFGTSETASAAEVGAFAGSLLGIFIWTFIAFLLAIGVAGIGFLLGRKGKQR